MFQRILVPLDGSQRAELALPVAVRLARLTGGSLIFQRVATFPADTGWYALEPPFRTHELLAAETRKASTYLAHKAWEMELFGVVARTAVSSGLPAQQLLSFLEEQEIDLVVMCSRGETCSPRRRMGSVAQQLLWQSPVPVLVLQEASGEQGMLHPQIPRPLRILVPLDGSSRAENALPLAAFVAARLSSSQPGSLHLVHILTGTEAEEAACQQARDNMQAYLQMVCQRLHAEVHEPSRLSLTTSVLIQPDVAESILRLAERWPSREGTGESEGACDAIAFARYSRSEPCRGQDGDPVIQRLLLDARFPLLVVPS